MSLVNFLAAVLLVLKGFTGSYGLAIILLTILVRVVLLPLTIKQEKARKDMARIQPEIKKIQAKHKEDKKKQQEEHLKLITEHGVNPLGGCLPLILQAPMFFALFSVLRQRTTKEIAVFATSMPALAKVSASLSTASFLGINSLGDSLQGVLNGGAEYVAALPNIILLVAMVGTQFLYMKQMSAGDKSQQMMMNMMVIMFGYFAYTFPAGLIIYWTTTNLVGLLEHQLIAKIHPAPAPINQGAAK